MNPVEWLKRWPLLIVGLTVITAAVTMFTTDEDKSDARALLLGLGAVILGAGLVLVVVSRDEPPSQ